MTRNQQMKFELYVMDLAVGEKCETAEDYESLAKDLHELVENAIQEMCMDNDIDDYSPSFFDGGIQ